jgi:Glycosyl hydrolase family 95 catalytic domain/Glycoside hydrolase family 95, C-terminal domain/Domain of unknown function (DUF5703)
MLDETEILEVSKTSRRDFLKSSALSGGSVALGLAGLTHHEAKESEGSLPLLEVNTRSLIARSDLLYLSPVQEAAEGQPIGNGRMGTLVWTSLGAIHFQINRVDVFAVNRNHAGKRDGPADYCGACAQIEIQVGGKPFAGEAFRQRLSVFEAVASVEGEGIQARCFASALTDVLVVELEDQRVHPQPVCIKLSMWRAPRVETGRHRASYAFDVSERGVGVMQRFAEADYQCASAVAIQVIGRTVQFQQTSARCRTIVVPSRNGKLLILISSSASWDAEHDAGPVALQLLAAASSQTCDSLLREHSRWWADFWSRTFVHLTSKDGLADFMERLRNLHLYLMASSSRGTLPAKWNGSVFTTQGDERGWGSQFWIWTTEISHFPLYAADAADLADPFFNMYVKQLPACQEAARQRWGVQSGAYFLEAGPFDGPVLLPDDVAREYQDVYLGRKPNSELSKHALDFGQFECVLTQFADERKPPHIAAGRYSYVSHIATSGSELAMQAWWRYRHSGDRQWLRTHGYPLLRETVEFYRHLVKKETDGRYHFYGLNQHEGAFGTNDGLLDIAAVRGTVPLAIRAAEILELEAELQGQWREFLDHLAPYPMGSDPKTHSAVENSKMDLWAGGYSGAVPHARYQLPADEKLWPLFPFEDWTLETRQPDTDKIVQTLVELNQWRKSLIETGTGGKVGANGPFVSSFRLPILVSRAGRGEDLPVLLAIYYHGFKPLPNGLSSFEPGPETQGTEILGCISTALQEGLLQSVSPRPGEPEIISVFPAWPKSWEASFRLLARGGFLVTASTRQGQIAFVEIESRLGETCRLRNPWSPDACLVIEMGGRRRQFSGELLRFATLEGKRYRLLPANVTVPAIPRISPNKAEAPASFSVTLSNGTTVNGTLGRQ